MQMMAAVTSADADDGNHEIQKLTAVTPGDADNGSRGIFWMVAAVTSADAIYIR